MSWSVSVVKTTNCGEAMTRPKSHRATAMRMVVRGEVRGCNGRMMAWYLEIKVQLIRVREWTSWMNEKKSVGI